MSRRLSLLVVLISFFAVTFGQNEHKLSSGTRFVIGQRDGKFVLNTSKTTQPVVRQWDWFQGKFINRVASIKGGTVLNPGKSDARVGSDLVQAEDLSIAEPFEENGKLAVQAWIRLTDNNTQAIEALGVEVTATFDKLVTANIPLDAIEKVAALKNVVKVSVAKRLQKDTYYARKYTNADDVQTWSPDAQTLGLLKAYTGEDVVIGIIDTGIQFDHKIFKDEDGNTRIKKAYVYSNNRLNEYTGSAIDGLTYDIASEDHGTHTSSIAGGSDFPFTGYYFDNDLWAQTGVVASSYTQATLTYGGMAPKADLVLCGLAGQLTDANISASIANIANYAKSVGKPYVISISLGSQYGPHDGTGDMAEVVSQYTGEGGIVVYAASNDGGENIYWGSNSVTRDNPIATTYDFTYSTSYLYGASITYARTPNVKLAGRFFVVDESTNEVLWYSSEFTEDTEISVSDSGEFGGQLSQYFTAYRNQTTNYGFAVAYFDQEPSGKWGIEALGYYLIAVNSNYKLGVSIYPAEAGVETGIDTWGLQYTYFYGNRASVTIGDQTFAFTDGNDEVSISDEAAYPDAIAVGAYTSGKGYVSAGGYVYSVNDEVGDIASFSSYQKEGEGPLGTKLPHITSPGHLVTAGYNRGDVNSSGPNGGDNLLYGYDANNPIGTMSGTSMATPAVSGIIALWLQADPTLTPDRVKEVLAATAIKDEFTSKANFGLNGKIDALAGIKYILGDDAQLVADPQALDFAGAPEEDIVKTFTVRAAGLTEDVTLTLNDDNGVFAIDKTTLTADEAEAGAEVTVTFNAPDEGDFTGDVTISTAGVDDVVVSLTAKAFVINYGAADTPYLDVAQYATIDDAGWSTTYVRDLYKYTEDYANESAWLTLSTYGAWSSVYYAPNAQKWIESSLGTSNTYAGTSWSATGIFQGASSYYSSTSGNNNGRSRAIGYNSRNNTAERAVTFYVTNTDEVRLLGIGANGASAQYPGSLTVYEVTVNGDGTLTQGAQAGRQTSTSTSTTAAYTLTVSNLDVEKVYKVVASTYRGYIYEVGFRTPITGDPTLYVEPQALTFGEIEANDTEDQTINVRGAFITEDVTLTLDDENNVFSLSKSSLTLAEAQAGEDITVSFKPTEAGTYSGSITVSSEGAEDVVVTLNATASRDYPDAWDVAISSYGLATLYLDFPVQIPYNRYDPDLLGVYIAYDISDGEVRLARLTDYIPAYTGVVVQGNAGTYSFPKVDKTVNVPELTRDNYLSGVLETTAVADILAETGASKVLTLGLGNQGYIGFYNYSGASLPAYKSFLLDGVTGGSTKAYKLNFEGAEATGINTVGKQAAEGQWTTLQGTRLNGRPTQSGIYIVNGRAVIVK